MNPTKTSRIILVYGSDTRLGTALSTALAEYGESVIYRNSDFFGTDVRAIHRDIQKLKPAVIINCMVDPDCGIYPYSSIARFVAPSHAMVQQARTIGARYIHCSSARVYGQQESLVDSQAYNEYDPWLAYGEDPWRAVCQSLEASLWQQVSPYSCQAQAETDNRFEYYLIRFGHLLHYMRPPNVAYDAHPLDYCVHAAVEEPAKSFICGRNTQRISPIDTASAANVLKELCKPRPRPTSGTYHIASKDSVTISELFNYIAMKTGVSNRVAAGHAKGIKSYEIYGVDADQALDTLLWRERGKTELPNWQRVVSAVLDTYVKR